MAVPVALESFVGVVLALEAQKLGELRIAAKDLLARAERVIREEPAAVSPSGDVDEAAERGGRVLPSLGRVRRVQVEDRARVGPLRPREEALVVTLDEPDRAVDAVDLILAEV